MNPDDCYLTITQALEYLAAQGVSVHRTVIQDACHDGRLPGAEMWSRVWMIPQSDLDRFVENRPGAPSSSWFTMEMASEYLATRGIRLAGNTLRNRCLKGMLPGAVQRGRFWMIGLEDLQQFAAGWDMELEQRRAQQRIRARETARTYQQLRRLGLAPARRRGMCRRCEILSRELVDGLCPECRRELAGGGFAWYPVEAAPAVALTGVFHAWGGLE